MVRSEDRLERLEVLLPSSLLEKMDAVMEFMDFKTRDKFAEASLRRLLDRYLILLSEVKV